MDLKPGHGWHRLLARMVTGQPATIHDLVKEARAPGAPRRPTNNKVRAAAIGLQALGLLETRGSRLHPTPQAANELARLDAAAREDA